jgi:hypothetical protein
MDADLAMHLGRRVPAGTSPPARRDAAAARRDAAAARRVFVRALRTLKVTPSEVVKGWKLKS